MDKDSNAKLDDTRSSSDESVEVDEITFEDLIRADDDEIRKSEASSSKYSDPLSLKDHTNDDKHVSKTFLLAEKEGNRGSTTSGSTKNVIVTSAANNNVIQSKMVAASSSPAFMKISSKSNAASTNGKIIYLQRPDGTKVPVRVPASIAPVAKNPPAKSTVQIHVIRAADGSLVSVKNAKSVNIPNVSQLAGKKMVATSSGAARSHMMTKAPGTTGGSITAPFSAAVTSAEAAKPKVRHVIAAKSVVGNTSNGSGKMLMQSSSGARQVMVSSPNVVKLSPTSAGGQLQAIQIPGKSGLQYVRVLNNTAGITHKIATSESATTPKYTLLRQTKPPMKIMVKSPINDRDRQKMMTTFPTYRKINDIMVKSKDNKISQINSEIRRFSTSGETRSAAPGNKYIVLSKSSLVRNTVTSQNQKLTQVRHVINDSQTQEAGQSPPPPAKKLYSVLRPTTEHKESKEVRDIKLESWAEPVPFSQVSASSSAAGAVSRIPKSLPLPTSDDGVTIRRKHCNCTKSQCLKLYCDCFANGEFCQDCNCKDCLNNLDNEDERQKAIRICLERNPNSFKPKITALSESDLRLHNKGCNCKRSGCLKNYCECYEAKIPCSSNCKCVGCRNVDDHPDLDMDVKKCFIPKIETHNRIKRTSDEIIKPRSSTQLPSTSSSTAMSISAAVAASAAATACGPPAEKQPCNFITQEVVDATIQCLIAQADECQKSSLTPYQTEKMVMEELGRCLVEIIDFSIRNTDQN